MKRVVTGSSRTAKEVARDAHGNPLLAWVWRPGSIIKDRPGMWQQVVVDRIVYRGIGTKRRVRTNYFRHAKWRVYRLEIEGHEYHARYVHAWLGSTMDVLTALKTTSGHWWVNAQGALERPATFYEVSHPDLAPRAGWEVRDPEAVAHLLSARKQLPGFAVPQSELDREAAIAFLVRRRERRERKIVRLEAQKKNWERKEKLAKTKIRKCTRALARERATLQKEKEDGNG